MAKQIKLRLQYQPTGRRGIDRSIVYVVGSLDESEARRLRGVTFYVDSMVDARRTHNDLLKMARKACDEGTLDEFVAALRSGPQARRESRVFRDFASEWFDNRVAGGALRESQVESDTCVLKNHLQPYFGSSPLHSITVEMIDRYLAQKRRQKHQYGVGYSPKSLNNHLSLLRRILETAREYELIEKNPVVARHWMKSEHTVEESRPWWTPEEQAKALAVLESWRKTEPRFRLPILVQLVTGIRFSEVRALRKEDLDLQAPGLWIRRAQPKKKVSTPKNGRSRFQALPRELADELRAWMLKTEGQLLFPSESGGPVSNNVLNRAYSRLAKEAGVRRITSHGARHTCGSSLAMMGAGQKMIATILGHTEARTTERYTHMRVEATREIVQAQWSRLTNP